jgi:hypothetical protein
MRTFFRYGSLAYAAGSLGGLANSVVLWAFGVLGISGILGAKLAPVFTAAWLYPRLVWGGIWGFLFLLPFLKDAPILRGAVYSLGPTLVQLFVVFPLKMHQGILGMGLGPVTPVLVIFFNLVWGIVASVWLSYMEGTWERSSWLRPRFRTRTAFS